MNIKQRKQRLKAIEFLCEYIIGTSQKNVNDFLNCGKLDINKEYLWEYDKDLTLENKEK